MCVTEEFLLLKGFQWIIINRAASRPGVDVSTKGRAHFIRLTYEPSTSLSGSLALHALEVAGLDRLAKSGGPTSIFAEGEALTT